MQSTGLQIFWNSPDIEPAYGGIGINEINKDPWGGTMEKGAVTQCECEDTL